MGDEQSHNNGVILQYKNDINKITDYDGSSYIPTDHIPKTDTWEFYVLVQKTDGLYFSYNKSDLSKFNNNTHKDVSDFISIGAFGVSDNMKGRFLDGQLDDIRIYNRALESTEIQKIYNNTKPM